MPEPQSGKMQPAEEVQARLAEIERLLRSDPAMADARAADLLRTVPEQPLALLFQGIARRLDGKASSAVDVLTRLCEAAPDAPLPHLQLGLALQEAGDRDAAVRSMRRAAAIRPDFSDAWLALADLLSVMGKLGEADRAFAMYIRHAGNDPPLRESAALLRESRHVEAESRLREHLSRHPRDVVALCMLADAVAGQGRTGMAEELLKKCLELAPGYRMARHNYAVTLMRQNRPEEALDEVEQLLAAEPADADLRILQAGILVRLLDYEQALAIYRGILNQDPARPGVWTSLGHTLRTLGHREQAVEAYRRAIAIAPDCGEAWWNLANLKTLRISDADLAAMRARLQNDELPAEDRIHFHFAIGKALQDRGEYGESFRHYAAGNELRRGAMHYKADDVTTLVRRSIAVFSRGFFAERKGSGAEAPDPVFIVGLPRSGSTLVEQILASHPAVEGTTELPDLAALAHSLTRHGEGNADYPEVLASLGGDELRRLGEAYLQRTAVQRKANAPFFIDKMPNNFMHAGLIHLILPHARIVDVRRHPLACGLSLFTHLFAQGQHFSYSLEDIGRYYRDYAALMAHFDVVLPGRVHRVIYESLVEDAEAELRRLLDYCGLPFERACLDFYSNTRAVSTASSEQVRRPIYRDALRQWRNYEPWLEPLKEQLGELIGHWPDPDTASILH